MSLITHHLHQLLLQIRILLRIGLLLFEEVQVLHTIMILFMASLVMISSLLNIMSVVSSLCSISFSNTTFEALSHIGWRQAMIDEMSTLYFKGTWDLVSCSPSKFIVGCCWVFTVKVGPIIDWLKARLVATAYKPDLWFWIACLFIYAFAAICYQPLY